MKTSRFTTSAGKDSEAGKAKGAGQEEAYAFSPAPRCARPIPPESFVSTTLGRKERARRRMGESVSRPLFNARFEELIARVGS